MREDLHFLTLWPDIGKRIEDVGQLVRWEFLGSKFPAVDGPVHEVDNRAISITAAHFDVDFLGSERQVRESKMCD